jgi:hypothetical protein
MIVAGFSLGRWMYWLYGFETLLAISTSRRCSFAMCSFWAAQAGTLWRARWFYVFTIPYCLMFGRSSSSCGDGTPAADAKAATNAVDRWAGSPLDSWCERSPADHGDHLLPVLPGCAGLSVGEFGGRRLWHHHRYSVLQLNCWISK